MIRKIFLLLAASVFLAFMPVSCEQPEPETPQPENQDQKPDEETPTKLKSLKGTVAIVDDMIFTKRPSISIQLSNPNEVDTKGELKVVVSYDRKGTVETYTDSVLVSASGTKDVVFTTSADLAPGFYNASVYVDQNLAKIAAFGIDPFDIVSAPDMQDDFDEFWAAAKAQLPELKEGETFTLQEINATSTHKIYLVEMQSVPNGLEGEPVMVRGFFVEPQDGKQHPVLMHFFGWDDRGGSVTVPTGGNSDFTEFYLSTRGQYHNNRPAGYEKTEKWIAEHGEWKSIDECTYAAVLNPNDKYDWFGFNFGDKDSFYYRGAFMDCVQAVRFMASRQTSDMKNLFAEGSSQGGALSYACAALSDYPFTALAANVAFLGDYPDYFQIAGWPANVAKENQGSMTDEQMYAFLSYFDTKNLATKISACG